MFTHIVPKTLHALVFATLLGLTALTTGVAFVDLGRWNTVVALAIAVCKASLVALFFMHLRWSSSLLRLVMLLGLIWLAILITLTLSDIRTRTWTEVPSGWQSSTLPATFSTAT